MKLNLNEIIWSIPIIVVLIYLVYYGFRAKDITNLCFNYCVNSKAYGYKIDGRLGDAFVLNENNLYCFCYYSFLNYSSNRTIKEIRDFKKIGGELSDKDIILPFR